MYIYRYMYIYIHTYIHIDLRVPLCIVHKSNIALVQSRCSIQSFTILCHTNPSTNEILFYYTILDIFLNTI